MPAFDVLIIGSGIAGAGAAYELSQGAKVLLLEREDAHGYHTTGRSAALYIEAYGNAAIGSLTRASRAFFEGPPEGFASYPLLTPRGCLYVGRPDQAAALARTFDKRRGPCRRSTARRCWTSCPCCGPTTSPRA